MKKTVGFRAWFYFRQGWTTYFAFIFAAINTLTVTYFLAIEKLPQLKQLFPTFTSYLMLVTLVGIPLLVLTGYVHYKKSPAFKAEAAISIESNPYVRRLMDNIELILQSQLKTTQSLEKIIKNEELTKEELDNLMTFNQKLISHIDKKIDTHR